MKRYIIERDIAGVETLDADALRGAAQTSNEAMSKLGGRVQWVESFVADNKTFCVYLADNEELVQDHARISGFPANRVVEVHRTIDPMTAQA